MLPVFEERLPPDEYAHWQTVIEQCCDDIDTRMTSALYEQHPELRKKAEQRLAKYGVMF